METLREQWESFECAVMPSGAAHVQRQEMRRAFYAGAWAMLQLTSQVAPAAVSEEQGVAMIEGWAEECKAFQRAVVEGRA